MVAAANTSVMSTYARYDLSFTRGDGSRLFTADGTAYLDFAAGIAVNSLGHSHPKLVQVLRDQAGKLWHTSNLYRIPEQEKLADRLAANSFADRVFFTNSGAEAMECAIKTARKFQSHGGHPERYRIITFEGAFHGRTLATIAAGGQEKHLAGFGPKVDGFDQVKLHDPKALEAAITDQTAAILVEPIQGEGGIRVVGADELKAMRALCDKHGLLLIFDEVQCGLGRTGKLFAYELAGVTPDIMALAKALGGGFPIGACLATEAAAAGMIAGSHGSTFGGNPLACAVANGVLDVLLEPGFIDRIDDLGGYLGQHLGALKAKHPDVIEEVRGIGLMRGLKLKQPNTELVSALQAEHVLTVGAGDNVLRLLPPLTVTEAEIDEAIAALDQACMALKNRNT